MQTLPDHGDNPRFLVPMQTLVVIWVLWLIYQTYHWYQLRRNAAAPGGGEGENRPGAAHPVVQLLACLLAGLALGAVLQAVAGQGMFLAGWLGAGVVLFICLVLMLLAWQWAGGGRWLALMIALAFILRLAWAWE